MKTKIAFILNHKKEFILLFLYIVLSFIAKSFHELYRDEAQAYLFVRDQSLIEIFNSLKYEGHPFFYFLLLFPFVKIGLPFVFIQILMFLISLSAIVILIFLSPFKFYIKILIIFSYMIGFYDTIFVRAYSLIPLLVLLIAVIYRKRYTKYNYLYAILMFILMNTHLYCVFFVLALVIIDAVEFFTGKLNIENINKLQFFLKKVLPAALIILSGAIILYITLKGTIGESFYNVNVDINKILSQEFLTYLYKNIIQIFSGGITGSLSYLYNFSQDINRAINIVVLIGLILLLFADLRSLFIVLFTALAILILTYSGSASTYYHFNMVFISGIFSLFVFYDIWNNKIIRMIKSQIIKPIFAFFLIIILSFNTIGYINLCIIEINKKQSTAYVFTDYIKQNGYDEKDTAIFIDNIAYPAAILIGLDNIKGFSVLGFEDITTFAKWDRQYFNYQNNLPSLYEIFDKAVLSKQNNGNTKVLVLINNRYGTDTINEILDLYDTNLLISTMDEENTLYSENFYLFEIL